MTDLVQDVISLVCMSTFLISMAIWIGAIPLPAQHRIRLTYSIQ